MNGLAVIRSDRYRQIMGDLLERVRLCFDESVFDLTQIEFDRRTAPDGHCPTCGAMPLTMGDRDRISGGPSSYAEALDESARLRQELQKAQRNCYEPKHDNLLVGD